MTDRILEKVSVPDLQLCYNYVSAIVRLTNILLVQEDSLSETEIGPLD